MRVRGPKSGFRRTIQLRRDSRHNITPAEQIFWSKVAGKQFAELKFRRQHGIGNCIVDFYCPENKLIVEIDGDTHAESQIEQRDKERTAYLESLGYTVIRYNNRDIMNNTDGVFEDLSSRLNQTMTPLTSPLMRGERGRSKPHEGEKEGDNLPLRGKEPRRDI